MSLKLYYDEIADSEGLWFYRVKDNSVFAHIHNSVEIVFVISGNFSVRIGGTEQVLHAGDIAFSDSYDVHLYESLGNTEVFVLVISSEYMRDFTTDFGGVFPSFMFKNEKDNSEIFKTLTKTFEHWEGMNSLMKKGAVNYILGTMAKNYPPLERRKDKGTELIIEVLSYINRNYSRNLSLRKLSEKFGYSYNYFSSVFGKYVNMNFREYLNRVRIQNAKASIEERREGVTIGSIAAEAGFESPNTFYRAYNRDRAAEKSNDGK